MREKLNISIEDIIKRWEQSTGVVVTDELLETPDFVCTLIRQEWYNIKNK